MSTPLERLHARAAYATSHNDNSAIFRSPATGQIIAWIDVSGTAHVGPVDVRAISPTTRAQLREADATVSEWEGCEALQDRLILEKAETVKIPAIMADEQTLDHVHVRPFRMEFHDSTPREVMGSMDDTFFELAPWSDIFRGLLILLIGWAAITGFLYWHLNRSIPVHPAPVPAPRVQAAPVEIDWVLLDDPRNWSTWPNLPQVSTSK